MGERGAGRALTLAAARLGDRAVHSTIVSTFLAAARDAGDALLAVVLSPSCAACGHLLQAPLAGPICAPCWNAVHLLAPPLCLTCGEPLPAWREADLASARCARCRRAPRLVSRARAAGTYEGTLRAAIHALKDQGRRSLARRLAQLIRQQAGDVLAGADAVVPVPLHRTRRRARGFNQAADLARHLDRPVADLLRRVRATAPQAELPAGRRYANVRDAFAPARAMRRWRGATLVLIDDVSTTGATLEACARTLLDAGAGDVRALTAARAVRSRR